MLEEDVRDAFVVAHGRFDVVLCLGILYHLDQPDVFRFLARLGELCDGLLILDTHVALTDAELAALDDPERGAPDPRVCCRVARRPRRPRHSAARAHLLRTPGGAARGGAPCVGVGLRPAELVLVGASTLSDLLADAGFGALHVDAPPAMAPIVSGWPARGRSSRTRRRRAAAARAAPPDAAPAPPPPSATGPPSDIVCFSIVPWNDRWQRPQQLLSGSPSGATASPAFARPPGPTTDRRRGGRRARLGDPAGGRRRSPTRAHRRRSTSGCLDAARARAGYGIGPDAISMVQFPSWAPIALAARAALGWTVVYDCMDEWDGFPGLSEWWSRPSGR